MGENDVAEVSRTLTGMVDSVRQGNDDAIFSAVNSLLGYTTLTPAERTAAYETFSSSLVPASLLEIERMWSLIDKWEEFYGFVKGIVAEDYHVKNESNFFKGSTSESIDAYIADEKEGLASYRTKLDRLKSEFNTEDRTDAEQKIREFSETLSNYGTGELRTEEKDGETRFWTINASLWEKSSDLLSNYITCDPDNLNEVRQRLKNLLKETYPDSYESLEVNVTQFRGDDTVPFRCGDNPFKTFLSSFTDNQKEFLSRYESKYKIPPTTDYQSLLLPVGLDFDDGRWKDPQTGKKKNPEFFTIYFSAPCDFIFTLAPKVELLYYT